MDGRRFRENPVASFVPWPASVDLSVVASTRYTPDDLKQLIEGRISALAKVHTLFVESRWAGAKLHSLATQELSPYSGETEGRVRIDGSPVMLEPKMAQNVAIEVDPENRTG